jgi:1-phosphatidylinositol-4-phosphate 5-kinase
VGTAIFSDFHNKRRRIVISFAAVTLSLYYFWHFVFWIFSVCVLIGAFWILRGHLAASSQTRKFVLKQNFYYVLVLGIETFLIVPIWVAQLSITKGRIDSRGEFYRNYHKYYPYYFSYTDLGLAIAFAIIHSSRGIVDLMVWLGTFAIGCGDIRELHYRIKRKLNSLRDPDGFIPLHSHSPLINKRESTVDRALRRNAMYCINIGILDAVTLHMEHQQRVGKVGLVDDSFVAAAMMQFDEENQQQAIAELYRNNPNHSEESLRKIQFPASSALGIAGFSFIDLEPSVFHMLRDCYGIDPHQYRASFRIRNAADIESSGMLEKFTEGKSGSFFYFTRDFKYIIKTVTDEEEKFLQRIAYRYYNHMKNNPNSLIVRVLGLHKVRLAKEQRFITVVVMENIFYNTEQFKMNERYDLKGSRVGRRSVKKTSKIRREYKGTLKDLDLGDKKIHVGADSKAQLLGQLRRDVEFLIQCKIMDYSMLLGIHNHSDDERVRVREGSIRGLGDSFIDVEIEKKGDKPQHTREDAVPMRSFRGRLSSNKSSGYNTRSTTLDSINESGDIVESQFHTKKPQIAWFREDYGGLRSTSTLHPLHKPEIQLHGSSDIHEQAAAEVPPATYYFGIVDILQQYNWQKKAEHHWKTKVACKDKHGISCVNEREYGERFLNFMDELFM